MIPVRKRMIWTRVCIRRPRDDAELRASDRCRGVEDRGELIHRRVHAQPSWSGFHTDNLHLDDMDDAFWNQHRRGLVALIEDDPHDVARALAIAFLPPRQPPNHALRPATQT